MLFSGDLEREIICNPFFFGKEKHLLRAQIARITQSTTLVPAGSYKLNEENDREIEEFVPDEDSKVEPLPTTTKAANLNAWVHHNASILNCCRTIHLDPPEEAPEGFQGDWDVEQAKKDIEKADPFEPRLKPISADEKIKMSGKSLQASWIIRLEGDKTEYVNEKGKTVCHGVVVVRSLIWPGAFTLYQNGKQTSVYVGNGQKFDEKTKPFPQFPPVLNQDPVEYGEYVLPEIKVMSPEEIRAKIENNFNDCWVKLDQKRVGNLGADDIKKVATAIKAKVTEKPQAEINEEAFDEAFEGVEKNEGGNV